MVEGVRTSGALRQVCRAVRPAPRPQEVVLKRTLTSGVVLAACFLGACTFGLTEVWVNATYASPVEAVAVAVNGAETKMFLYDYNVGRLKLYNPGVDAVLSSVYVGYTGSASIVSLAPDRSDDARVVALGRTGYVRAYEAVSDVIMLKSTTSPRLMGAATERIYCDLAKASNGDLYVTSVDKIAGVNRSVLARRTAAGAWTTAMLPDDDCASVAVDTYDGTVVASFDVASFQAFSPALVPVAGGPVLGDYYAASVNDFDVVGGVIFAVGMAYVTDPHPEVWSFALADGALLDREHVNGWWASSAQLLFQGEGLRGLWADPYGDRTIQVIELLP